MDHGKEKPSKKTKKVKAKSMMGAVRELNFKCIHGLKIYYANNRNKSYKKSFHDQVST